MNKQTITVVDAPEVSLAEGENAGEALLKFYRALDWNGVDKIDPCKVHTTKVVFDYLYGVMIGRCPDPVAVGMAMVNKGPSTDEKIPAGKVYLYEGWITPEPNHVEENPFKGREDERNCHCNNCGAKFMECEILCKGEDEYCPSCKESGCIADD